jgi:hypothetical protein
MPPLRVADLQRSLIDLGRRRHKEEKDRRARQAKAEGNPNSKAKAPRKKRQSQSEGGALFAMTDFVKRSAPAMHALLSSMSLTTPTGGPSETKLCGGICSAS